jgi:hypothetical protein
MISIGIVKCWSSTGNVGIKNSSKKERKAQKAKIPIMKG